MPSEWKPSLSAIADCYKRDMLTFGESYMDGLWDVPDLEETFFQMIRNGEFLRMMRAKDVERISPERSGEVIKTHYDLGNDLFETMCGPTLSYTCGYWKDAISLDEAQKFKMTLVARKIELRPGMSVLDLGCGLGAFGKYFLATGIDVTGVTLSAEQAKVASQYGLVQVCDYSEATGQYDRVIALGLMEHVGWQDYRKLFRTMARCLKPDGIAFLHTIARNTSHKIHNPWINKYIFPNSMLPSMRQIAEAAERIFVIEDVHNIADHYPPTIRAWWDNCEKSELRRSGKYSERFWRMWKFYLLLGAASFRSRDYQLYHIVMTKKRDEIPARVA